MSDNPCHIRDLMNIDLKDIKATGQVPNVSICGESDPMMNKLCFGDFEAVLNRKVKNPCEKCIKKWKAEEDADPSHEWKRTYNTFRKAVHKGIRGDFVPRK